MQNTGWNVWTLKESTKSGAWILRSAAAVQDALFNGERFRVLTVVDNCTGPPGGKVCHALLAGKSLRGIDVVAELSRICLIEGRTPERIQCDNGSEFIRGGGPLQGNGLMGIFEWCDARLFKTRKTDRQSIC